MSTKAYLWFNVVILLIWPTSLIPGLGLLVAAVIAFFVYANGRLRSEALLATGRGRLTRWLPPVIAAAAFFWPAMWQAFTLGNFAGWMDAAPEWLIDTMGASFVVALAIWSYGTLQLIRPEGSP